MTLAGKIDHPLLQSMYRYWLDRRRDRRMPARRDLQPQDVPALLPHIFLVDVLPEGYRFRLVGTHIAEHVGVNATGKTLEEAASGDFYQRARRDFDAVAQGPAIHYLASELYWRNRDWMMYRRLLLPLSDDGRQVNMLLGAGAYEPRGDLDAAVNRQSATVTVHELENALVPL
jgi:hypothetical protein